MSEADPNSVPPQTSWHYRQMTVAAIRSPPEAPELEVVFLESARFYRLTQATPTGRQLAERLRTAHSQGRPLRVGTASLDSDRIEDLQYVPS